MRARLSTILFICAAATLAAQNAAPVRESPQSTFRSAANYVRVDMYATRDGAPIEDLKQDEIEILEDGAPQRIEAFEHVRVRPSGSPDTRIEPNTVAESRQMAGDPRARVFVIYLDTYNTQIEGSANMRLPLVKFLDRVLGPDDLVAIMTPRMGGSDITFGRKTTVISGVMNDAFWGQRGRALNADPKEDTYDACYPPQRSDAGSASSAIAREMKERRREKLALDGLEDLTTHLNGVREERKAVLVVTEGWKLFGPNRQLADAQDRPPSIATPGGTFGRGRRGGNDTSTDRPTSDMRVECDTDRVALANVDHRNRLREITDTANRSNTSFYTVYARGLVAFDAPIGPDRPPSIREDAANLSARQDSLRFLADNTDAIAVINTNNIDGALTRIAADVSSYYLLGYYSSNTKLDGKFRNISVRVKRPGTQVRARRGYRGPTADALFAAGESAKAAATATPVTGALGAVAGVNARAPFRLRTSSWRSTADGDAAALWVVGELDYTTRRQVTWSAGAKADVAVVAADGKQVASTTVDVAATEGGFTLRVPDSAALTSGEYAIRVRVRSDADPNASLSETTRAIVPSTPSALGEAVLWRRGPSTGLRHLSTADPRFQRTERIRLELPTRAAGTAAAHMLDRTGKPLQIPLQVSDRADPAGFRWVVVDGTLAPLAAGDYAIEVTLGDGKQVTAFRVVP
jgi:VWFA-related protein